jgi:hypothetical protein
MKLLGNRYLMPTTGLLLAIFFLPSSFAAGVQMIQFDGINEMGEKIGLFSDTQDVKINKWTVTLNRKSKDSDYVYQEQSCIRTGQNENPPLHKWKVSCDKNGSSILAGVDYKFQKDLGGCKGYLFICTSGCVPLAPKEMVLDAGCDAD